MDKRKQEREELLKYHCHEKDDFNTHGVLLSNEIKYYASTYKMIDPFDEERLKPAAYELRVGDEYALGGKIGKLSDDAGKNLITIPPFEVVIISTMERINLPRFIIARWNIRVRKAYEGLLWVGGPQVDPGWVGYLRCPIYNLSNKNVTLRLGEAIAIIDFVKTTPFSKDCIEYDRPPKRIVFDDYDPEKLESALYKTATERIKNIEGKVDKVESSISLVFAIVAILFTALTLFVTIPSKSLEDLVPKFSINGWCYVSVIMSVAAIVITFSKPLRPIKKSLFFTIVVLWLGILTLILAKFIIKLGIPIW